MKNKIIFCISGDYIQFQADNRFYLNLCKKLSLKLKSIFNCIENFDLVNELPISNNKNIYLDIRVGLSNSDTLIQCLVDKVNLYSEFGIPLLLFSKTNNLNKKILTNSLINPAMLLSALMDNTKQIFKNSKILQGAIVNNSYIGRNCVIGNNCLIRNSYIDDNSVIGYNTEVNASYIGKNSTLHTNFIGNSIVGDNCHFGFMSCTTVIRLDGKNIIIKLPNINLDSNKIKLGAFIEFGCTFGAYALIMPGVCIGKNSVIRPYTRVDSYIPSFSYTKTVLNNEIKPNNLIDYKNDNYTYFRKELEKELK